MFHQQSKVDFIINLNIFSHFFSYFTSFIQLGTLDKMYMLFNEKYYLSRVRMHHLLFHIEVPHTNDQYYYYAQSHMTHMQVL